MPALSAVEWVHFIFRSSRDQPMELLRDFKKFTSKKVIEVIENNPPPIIPPAPRPDSGNGF